MYYILKYTAKLIILLLVNFSIRGKENIPMDGPVLVVSNHLSVSDPVLIGVSLKRKIIFMAKEELFKNRFTGYFVRQFGAFPVYRGSSSRDALRQANEVLGTGKPLGMFPEGKRSKNGSLMPALFGAAMIAYHNNVKIIPVGLTGTEMIHGFRWLIHRPRVTLVIGQPFCLNLEGKALSKEQLSTYTDLIMNHIAELLPKKYQGKYSK